mmetsp:Transcript_4323/g.9858  ORF Transcript_4323/g.9858 Transcript_4323/m.9858 type:complete len:317 (+) Transcript_4323:211-1161(+)
MVVVHSTRLYRRFHAPLLSSAFVFVALYWISVVIFAFLIAFFTNNLWVKESSYREQPDVAFVKRFSIKLQGVGADGMPLELSYSTVPSINTLAGNTLRVPTVRSSLSDPNLDLLSDIVRVNISFPLSERERVHSVQAVYALSYKLRNHVRLETEAPLPLTFHSGVAGRALYVDGRLKLKLANPLPIVPRVRGDEGGVLLDTSKVYTSPEASMAELMRQAASRNDSITLDPSTNAWDAALPSCGDVCGFTVALTIRIHPEKVLYIPPFIEVAKFSWIQFLATFVFLFIFTRPLLNFIMHNQIVQTVPRDDVAKAKII